MTKLHAKERGVQQDIRKSATPENIISQQYSQIAQPRSTIHPLFPVASQNV
jgi:hypothetical protein